MVETGAGRGPHGILAFTLWSKLKLRGSFHNQRPGEYRPSGDQNHAPQKLS